MANVERSCKLKFHKTPDGKREGKSFRFLVSILQIGRIFCCTFKQQLPPFRQNHLISSHLSAHNIFRSDDSDNGARLVPVDSTSTARAMLAGIKNRYVDIRRNQKPSIFSFSLKTRSKTFKRIF